MARDDERDGLEHTGYRSGQVRIVGAEPAGRSAAMRSEDPPGEVWDGEAEENRSAEDGVVTPPLPHWTEPATGEVPAILARDPEDEADPFASLPGPSWRQDDSDWDAQDEDFEPSMLAGDQTGQGSLDASTNTADRQPWVFDLPGTEKPEQAIFGDEEGWDDAGDWEDLSLAAPGAWDGEQGEDRATRNDGPITEVIPVVSRIEEPLEPAPVEADQFGVGLGGLGAPLSAEESDDLVGDFAPLEPALVIDDLDIPLDEPRSRFSLRRRSAETGAEPQPVPERRPAPARIPRPPRRPAVERTHPPGGPQQAGAQRNVAAAIVSGLVLGGLALITFKIGPAAAVGLVTLVVTLAAAEGYAAFRQGGYHPVTLLGLVATISLMIATYNRGEAALPLVFVLLLVACFVWHLAGVESTDAVRSTGTTLFVFGWVAVFGSFGALLLSPALFPERHGIAFLLGGVIAGVSYDVGALTVGAWLGRHPMSSVSPNKTWEGFVGGLVTSLLLSVVIVHLIHPWTVGKAAVLALVVSVVATLGDLFESTVKRHLGRKDMGRLLPGHGGLLDRVDGLLFVLPATYYLVIAFHLA